MLYADSIKTQLTSTYLTNGGKYSEAIDLDDDNLDKAITCEEVHYTKDSQVLLGNCTIKGSNESYWYVNGEITDVKPDHFESLKLNLLSSNEYIDGSVWSGKGTGSWDVNQSYQPKTVDPFFIRGGYWGDDSFAGLFAFNATYGLNYIHNSFRPVVMSK